uniref:Pentraxin fusion protein-like n=1 Tax=Crassostrea virginica TaxID=6565 RepID=A0A8B8BEA7_CRAVI|nr:pentraxin fusion protein-like [Crassostrea virginica]
MATVLQCFALLCACCIDTTFSHFELKNVAYPKQVSLSSGYQGNTFPGSLAVNGIFSDFAHTGFERSPWMRVDLGARYRIHEIEVFARSDGYGHQLHDFDARVGDTIYDMHLCGHFTGVASNAQRIAIWCLHNTVGGYVQVQIVAGSTSVLSPAEILVWGD